MADAVDSKSTGSNTLWVQVSFPGPLLKSLQIVKTYVFNYFFINKFIIFGNLSS